MKRILTAVLSAALTMGCFCACGTTTQTQTAENVGTASAQTQKTNQTNNGDKIKIVTTIFPEYDWVKNILGENAANAELTLLLDSGVDLHSYQPTAEDILKISDCDLFIYVGGESDGWVKDALEGATNKNMEVIDLLEVIGDEVWEEEIKEGMQDDDDHDRDDDDHDDHDHDDDDHDDDHDDDGHDDDDHGHHRSGDVEYDEHVWLSLKNAKIICEEIADELGDIDPANDDLYEANYKAYAQELDALDQSFAELAGKAKNKTLIFGDRFPFRYFVEDYGFDYYAAFVGCSAETEASFDTIVFLAQKMDELGCGTIYTIESSDQKIARAVIESTKAKDQKTAVLDSMQSVTGTQAAAGTDYISIMQNNYDVLRDTLN